MRSISVSFRTCTLKSFEQTLLLAAGHHVDEEVVALLLVLLLRVALAVAAEADAVAQVLHVREVVDPRPVDLLEVEVAEDAEEELRAHLLLLGLDRLLGRVEERLRELLGVVQVLDVAAA